LAEHSVVKREQAPIRFLFYAVEHFFAACLIRSLGRFLSNQAACRAKFVFLSPADHSEIRKHNGRLVAVIGWTSSILELLTIRESGLIARAIPFPRIVVTDLALGAG